MYYMLFRENANETIWKGFIESTLDNTDTLPIVYYRPLKIGKLFM